MRGSGAILVALRRRERLRGPAIIILSRTVRRGVELCIRPLTGADFLSGLRVSYVLQLNQPLVENEYKRL